MNMQSHTEDFVDLRKQDSAERTIPVLAAATNVHTQDESIHQRVVRISQVFNAKTIKDLGLEGRELDAQRPLYENHAKGWLEYVVIGLVAMLINKMKASGGCSQAVLTMQEQIGVSSYSMPTNSREYPAL